MGYMKNLRIVTKSGNRKLGSEVVSTYRPVGPTCPANCSMLNKGCYAQRSFTGIAARNSATKNDSFDEILKSGKTLVRHHVSGDVFANDTFDKEYVSSLIEFHQKNPQVKGWLYTHRLADWIKAGYTANRIPENLVVIASCDKLSEQIYAKKNGFRYARVTEVMSRGQGEKLCPFDHSLHTGKLIEDIKVTCANCKLCFNSKEKANIVFLKH